MAEKELSEFMEQYPAEELKLKVPKDATIDLNLMPHNIWLQYKTISVGVGKDKKTFDLIKIFEGLERLSEVK